MDFTFSDDQQAIADLAAQILGDMVTQSSLRALEGTDGDLFAADAWRALAQADLLGVVLPVEAGGGGYGMLGAALVLTEIGRTVAPVPYLASIVTVGMTIADHGTTEHRAELLPAAIDGSRVFTAALTEAGSSLAPSVPATTAVPDDSGWRLDGEKTFVPWLPVVAGGGGPDERGRVLVPASTPDGRVVVALVDPGAGGVTLTPLDTTSGWPEADLRLEGVQVGSGDVLDGDGAAITTQMADRATAGLCALQAGVSAGAVRLTATYTTERTQFGSPIATFQAVAQRAADAYIDAEGIRFTAWQAAWRLDEGLSAADELDIAKFWAAEAGSRVARAAQHLHGGIGVDTDYPLHRYYRLAKHLELTLGGGTERLLRLGARMAAS
jgi:3-oxocholest-4-en-26-oyl-CoA dehydrogenase beta subunit